MRISEIALDASSPRRCSRSTRSTPRGAPRRGSRLTAVRVRSASRGESARRRRAQRGKGLVARQLGDHRDRARARLAQGQHGREASRARRRRRRRASRRARAPRCTSCCSIPVFITPSGRAPAIRRAERGRSRQPVASTHRAGRRAPPGPGPVSSSSPVPRPAGHLRAEPRARRPRARRRARPARGVARARTSRGADRAAPKPWWSQWRGTPPGLRLALEHERPTPTPSRRSSIAAASPAGPPPTIATSACSALDCRGVLPQTRSSTRLPRWPRAARARTRAPQ